MEQARKNVFVSDAMDKLVIAIDFDGTLAMNAWPDVNCNDAKPNPVVVDWVIRHAAMGDEIILWTCRENYGGMHYPDGDYLNDAIQYCIRNGIVFNNVNRNSGETYREYIEESNRFGRKITADAYIDDHSLPFDPDSPFAYMWWKIYLWLMDRKLNRLRKHKTAKTA